MCGTIKHTLSHKPRQELTVPSVIYDSECWTVTNRRFYTSSSYQRIEGMKIFDRNQIYSAEHGVA
jgi:hypothetical protein